jgi:hypothetical protein
MNTTDLSGTRCSCHKMHTTCTPRQDTGRTALYGSLVLTDSHAEENNDVTAGHKCKRCAQDHEGDTVQRHYETMTRTKRMPQKPPMIETAGRGDAVTHEEQAGRAKKLR